MAKKPVMTGKLMAIFAVIEFPSMLAGVYLFAKTDFKAVGLAIAIVGGMLPSLLFSMVKGRQAQLPPAMDDQTE